MYNSLLSSLHEAHLLVTSSLCIRKAQTLTPKASTKELRASAVCSVLGDALSSVASRNMAADEGRGE